MKSIAIINESSVITDAQLAVMVAACQIQISRDFAPAWGVDAQLRIAGSRKQGQTAGKPEPPQPGEWQLVILDTSDQAGALGYHDTTPEGLPMGKVFAKSDLEAGSIVSATLSHELLEMLADPDISRLVQVDDKTFGRVFVYALEVCDPCEDDKWNYKIEVRHQMSDISIDPKLGIHTSDGQSAVGNQKSAMVEVSDFIYPRWFHNYRINNVGAPTVNVKRQYSIDLQNTSYGKPGWWIRCGECKKGVTSSREADPDLKVYSAALTEPFPHLATCSVKISPDEDQRAAISAHEQTLMRFDHAGHITAPFQILEGGYISYSEVKLSWRDAQKRKKTIGGLASFIMAGGAPNETPLPYRARPRVGSRRERRRTARDEWQRSKSATD